MSYASMPSFRVNTLRSGRVSVFVLLGLVLLLASACNPVYSPPMRTTHYGAPGHVTPGQGRIGVAATSVGSFGPSFDWPLSENWLIEASGDLRFDYDGDWMMGALGARHTFRDLFGVDATRVNGLHVDVAFGVGVGVGGASGNEAWEGEDGSSSYGFVSDGKTNLERTALGGYAEVGLGYRMSDLFSPFVRSRFQVSTAEGLPVTLFTSALAGIDFTFGPVALYLAGGFAGYENEVDGNWGFMADAGLSLRFSAH